MLLLLQEPRFYNFQLYTSQKFFSLPSLTGPWNCRSRFCGTPSTPPPPLMQHCFKPHFVAVMKCVDTVIVFSDCNGRHRRRSVFEREGCYTWAVRTCFLDSVKWPAVSDVAHIATFCHFQPGHMVYIQSSDSYHANCFTFGVYVNGLK